MDDTLFFALGLIINLLISVALGQSRGRPVAGLIFGLLLGPIGWLLIIIGPNYKKAKEDAEKKAAEDQRFFLQQRQLQEIAKAQKQGNTQRSPSKVRVSRGGEDLGEMDIPKVKLMLKNGSLVKEDLYFDEEIGDWVSLDMHPDLGII